LILKGYLKTKPFKLLRVVSVNIFIWEHGFNKITFPQMFWGEKRPRSSTVSTYEAPV